MFVAVLKHFVLEWSTLCMEWNRLTVMGHWDFSKTNWFTREVFTFLCSVVCTHLCQKRSKGFLKYGCENVLLKSPNKCIRRCIKSNCAKGTADSLALPRFSVSFLLPYLQALSWTFKSYGFVLKREKFSLIQKGL